jgi:hypothetical protein
MGLGLQRAVVKPEILRAVWEIHVWLLEDGCPLEWGS